MKDDVKIICHGNRSITGLPIEWREPKPKTITMGGFNQGNVTRACSYCGSIHPKDLIEALKNGATMHGADWKYGYPHKFYVDNIPNPIEGEQIVTGHGPGEDDVHFSKAGKAQGKFYVDHLLDLDDEDFQEITCCLKENTDIEFFKTDEGKMQYKAPHHNYQRQ